MDWVYERSVSHKGVNYHLWSTSDPDVLYALTRAAVIEPQTSAQLYRSLPELAAKTSVPVAPLETRAPTELRPIPPVVAGGLYRREDGWVQVDYGSRHAPLPRDLYDDKGYEPPYAQLLLEAEYQALETNLPQLNHPSANYGDNNPASRRHGGQVGD